MTLRVIRESKDTFWVYQPLGGRGRHCWLNRNRIAHDKSNGMFYEPSPAIYQKAIDNFLTDESEVQK